MNFKKSKLITNIEEAIFESVINIKGNLLIKACYSKLPSYVNEDNKSWFRTYEDLQKIDCNFVIRTNNKTKVYKTLRGVINQIKKQ